MMEFLLFLFTVVILSNHRVSSTVDLPTFQQEALDEHNALRQRHCTVAMTLTSSLNTIAQAYAQYLIDNNLFVHSYAPNLGENLWESSSTTVITYINGSSPTGSWYNEISSYNYNSPGYADADATGHFTQVVWKDSTQLGMGIAFKADNMFAIVVGNYFPEGNIDGGYEDNVLRPCYSDAGGD